MTNYDDGLQLLDAIGFRLNSNCRIEDQVHSVLYTATLIAVYNYQDANSQQWELNIDHRDAYRDSVSCPIRLTPECLRQVVKTTGYHSFLQSFKKACSALGNEDGYEDSMKGRKEKYRIWEMN